MTPGLDLGGDASIWRQIRAVRSSPSGFAGLTDERRETFGAELEQSEQPFDAAGAVGYEAQALPLFYALSQAGRAIMAMSSKDDWKTSSHGMRAKQLDGSVCDVELQNQKKGLFISVADEIRSSGLVEAVRLGDVLAGTPEVSSTVPRAAAVSPALLLRRRATADRSSGVVRRSTQLESH